jgi:histidine kinase
MTSLGGAAMSIKKRLILSNIAMILVPFALFLLIELIAGYVLFYVLDRRLEGADQELFTTIRIAGLLIAITVSNALITYIVSKSILIPIRMLTLAAKQIADGRLEFSLQSVSKDEIGELASIFEHMRGKLLEAKKLQERYEENRKQLVASISHDLRTPMTSIKGYARGIVDGIVESPERTVHYANIIYSNANTLETMIDELFLYSKLDLNKVPMLLEEIDLRAYMNDYVEELAFSLMQEGGKVTFKHHPAESYMVLADRDQLRRVVENIVQNSLKYMDKEEKMMEVRLVSEQNQVRVEIEDNGTGIASESLPYIFDSFYRTDTARSSSTGGSGLGMAIAKQIIEAHGGTMEAASTLGAGTTICFRLNKAERRGTKGAENIDH